jgi:hypothetical protein
MSVQSDYEKLKKGKKGLPDWKWLKKNFKVKDEDEALETIRVAIGDKVEAIAKGIIEPIISGQEHYCCWFERKMLSDADGKILFNAYKDLQSILWGSNKISLSCKQADYIKWLIDVKKKWDKHSPILEKICDKVAVGWEKYTKKETTNIYHG